MPGFRPRVEAAVERDGAHVAHRPQRRRRERGDLAELAVRENADRRVRELLVDAQLELSARDVARARQMRLLEGVALADVEEDEIAAAAVEPIAELVERHERQAFRRL